MLRLASDENFKGEILRGLRRRLTELDVVRVQDVRLSGVDDPAILAWAAAEGRILLTHDRNTMPGFAYDRVRNGDPMPGIFVVRDTMPAGQAIEELLLAIQCSPADEWNRFVTFFPL